MNPLSTRIAGVDGLGIHAHITIILPTEMTPLRRTAARCAKVHPLFPFALLRGEILKLSLAASPRRVCKDDGLLEMF